MDGMQTTVAPVNVTPVPVPSRPMLPPLGTLFREAWAEYRGKLGIYVPIALVPALIQLVMVLGAGSIGGGTILLFVGGVIALVIFSILAQGALLLIAIHSGETMSFGEAYRKSMSYFWPMVWVSILTSLLVGGAMILFIVPAIIMSYWFVFALVLLFAENDRGFKALLKSREYVRDYWGAIFGRVLLLGLLVGLVAQIPAYILTGLQLHTVSTLYSTLIYLITVPFSAIYSVKLFQQLKSIKSVTETQVMAAKNKVLQVSLAGYGLFVIIIGIVIYISVRSSGY